MTKRFTWNIHDVRLAVRLHDVGNFDLINAIAADYFNGEDNLTKTAEVYLDEVGPSRVTNWLA